MRPYDDDRYIEWQSQFQNMIYEYLDTEGNDVFTLKHEIENAIENAKEEIDDDA